MGHICQLKSRLAKLKREVLTASSSDGKSGEGFDVAKTGHARVGFVGFPSVGKSTLLTKLTDAVSESADYEFTTLNCIPGLMFYKGCKIQLLDLPGIIEGAKDGKGRGKQVIGVARTCDLILVILDSSKPISLKKKIEHELEGFGIRLNKNPPEITFERKIKGGIAISKNLQSNLTDEQIKTVCKEFKVNSANINVKCDSASVDDLIDVIEGNRVYIPSICVLNKIDRVSVEELDLFNKLEYSIPISSSKEWNLDNLKEMIWSSLNLMRIYPKTKKSLPDFELPVILKKNKRTIKDFCEKIHRGLLKDFKNGLVWGTSVKYYPQSVGKAHILEDEDVVQIIKN